MLRSRRDTVSCLPGNWAELLLNVGRCVRRQMRRGAGTEEVARCLAFTTDYCELALEFACSSDLLKLRAMVEGWALDRIIAELGRAKPACLCPRS